MSFPKIIYNSKRDRKCLICCLELPNLLNACHLKPYAACNNEIEQYDDNNGILMCCNHHKLYDAWLFALNIDGTITISKQLDDVDDYLLIKQFEPCFKQSLKKYLLISIKGLYWVA